MVTSTPPVVPTQVRSWSPVLRIHTAHTCMAVFLAPAVFLVFFGVPLPAILFDLGVEVRAHPLSPNFASPLSKDSIFAQFVSALGFPSVG